MKIAEIVSSLCELNAPVIFSDTCSILDIFRAVHKTNINITHVSGFKRLPGLIEKGKIQSVITYTVKEEFLTNEAGVYVELEKTINKLIQNNEKFISVLQSLGIGYEFHFKGIEDINLPKVLKESLRRFIERSLVLDKDEIVANKAVTRFEKNEPPTSQNKKELKDCLIIEHYLELAQKLRDIGFSNKIFFMTSNSSDYGKIGSLKPPLDSQLSGVKMDYRDNYNWILSELEL